MDGFLKSLIGAGAFVLLCAGIGIYLGGNYAFRWNQACALQGGLKMENTSGTTICVRGPVQLINIAVRPW